MLEGYPGGPVSGDAGSCPFSVRVELQIHLAPLKLRVQGFTYMCLAARTKLVCDLGYLGFVASSAFVALAGGAFETPAAEDDPGWKARKRWEKGDHSGARFGTMYGRPGERLMHPSSN